MASDIKIRTLTGSSIKTYIQSIAKVRQEVLSEIPYLQLGGPEIDLQYLRHISLCKDSIAVLVFDGPKIVGVSTGTPLAEELPGFQEPFLKKGISVEDHYYFGLSALLKPYRSRGIAHHFFDLREEHVRHLKRFGKICFTSTIPPKGAARPIEQTRIETFWQKRGYIEHPHMTCLYPILDRQFSIPLKFWIKNLSTRQAAASHSELEQGVS